MNPFVVACQKGQLDKAKRVAQENPDLDIHALLEMLDPQVIKSLDSLYLQRL